MKWVDVYSADREGNPKSVFAEGEEVQLYMEWRNDGEVPSTSVIVITDVTTGEELWKAGTGEIGPGESMFIRPPVTGLELKMPAYDWSIRIDITP